MAVSAEQLIGRMEERIEVLIKGQERADMERSQTNREISMLRETVMRLEHRVGNMEEKIISYASTIQTMDTMQKQFKGASKLVSLLYFIGGGAIACLGWYLSVRGTTVVIP